MKIKNILIYIAFLIIGIIFITLIINRQISKSNFADNISTKIQNQWALRNTGQTIKGISGKKGFDVNAIGAWNVTLGDKSVVVGILDTGIQVSSPAIANNIFVNTKEIPNNLIDDNENGFIDDVNGWDFYNNDNSVYDDSLSDYHGTFIASLIVGSHNNKGIWGIAPNVKILPLKFMRESLGNVDDASKAIDYAYKMGVKIINCSWDNMKYDNNLYETMKKYKNILFVCSSGKGNNDLRKIPVYPACFNLENVICVGAVDNNGNKFELSGFSLEGEVFAPGKDILGMLPDEDTSYSDGTSFATAYVTGIAALVNSYKPDITTKDLAKLLKSSKSEIGEIIDAKLCLDNASKIK